MVLSCGIPFALIPLLIHCRNRNLMGAGQQPRDYRHSHRGLGMLIGALNVFVLYQTFFS